MLLILQFQTSRARGFVSSSIPGRVGVAGHPRHDLLEAAVFLRRVPRAELHHPGVGVVAVVQRPEGDVGQDAEVAGAAAQHRPEQRVIVLEKILPFRELAKTNGYLNIN